MNLSLKTASGSLRFNVNGATPCSIINTVKSEESTLLIDKVMENIEDGVNMITIHGALLKL